jgi:hypothetical protein
MAEQVTIPELNEGVPLSDATDSQFYVVKDGQDYPLNFDTIFAYIYRANPELTADGTEGQTITYSTPFLNIKPTIFDPLGLGIELVSWDETGFVINSYGTGNFAYITLKTR